MGGTCAQEEPGLKERARSSISSPRTRVSRAQRGRVRPAGPFPAGGLISQKPSLDADRRWRLTELLEAAPTDGVTTAHTSTWADGVSPRPQTPNASARQATSLGKDQRPFARGGVLLVSPSAGAVHACIPPPKLPAASALRPEKYLPAPELAGPRGMPPSFLGSRLHHPRRGVDL